MKLLPDASAALLSGTCSQEFAATDVSRRFRTSVFDQLLRMLLMSWFPGGPRRQEKEEIWWLVVGGPKSALAGIQGLVPTWGACERHRMVFSSILKAPEALVLYT